MLFRSVASGSNGPGVVIRSVGGGGHLDDHAYRGANGVIRWRSALESQQMGSFCGGTRRKGLGSNSSDDRIGLRGRARWSRYPLDVLVACSSGPARRLGSFGGGYIASRLRPVRCSLAEGDACTSNPWRQTLWGRSSTAYRAAKGAICNSARSLTLGTASGLDPSPTSQCQRAQGPWAQPWSLLRCPSTQGSSLSSYGSWATGARRPFSRRRQTRSQRPQGRARPAGGLVRGATRLALRRQEPNCGRETKSESWQASDVR